MTFSFCSNGIQFKGCNGGIIPPGEYVTPDGVQTLTNKTIDAEKNTIENINIQNFKEGLVRENVRDVDTASNDYLVTEKAVSLANDTFVFEQAVASDTWVVVHNLNKYPSVMLVDSAGTQFIAPVNYDSRNQLTVYINGKTTGKVFLN